MILQGSQGLLQDLLDVLQYGDEIIQGLGLTLWLYAIALTLGFFLGLSLALGRQYGGWLLSRVATTYIEAFRGTPLLIQTFIIYFFPSSLSAALELQGLPPLPLRWSIDVILLGKPVTLLNHRILSAIAVLSLNSAAYQAEYLRGAIASVSAGQLLAARSLGMSRLGGIRRVVLPQALRRAIPAWSNEATYLPVYTVAVYFIGVEELFAKAYFIVTRTFLPFVTYGLIGVIFLVIVTVISRVMDFVHERTRIPGL